MHKGITWAKLANARENDAWNLGEIRLDDGFNPNNPQNSDGIRILPATSDPSPIKEHRELTSAA